ncbi:MAG: bifunctional oligoribonuclease/PAP phosphatase NrnA [Marinifilaceae bacterium]
MNNVKGRINLEQIEEFKEMLKEVRQIAIVPHSGPDGDAIGSSLALYQYFKKKGIAARIISPNEYPVFLRWLPQNAEVAVYTEQADECLKWLENSNMILMVDHNSYRRSGDLEEILEKHPGKKVMIDHHPDPESILDLMFSEVAVSSTCELVYEFIAALGDGELIDAGIAECLYTGIMTDTGSLSYNSSDPRTYYIVADLLSQGIDKAKIHSNVYDNYSADRMKLLGYCLNDKMEVLEEYRTAIITLTQEELKKFNFKDGDTEGFVNYPLSIKGVVVSLIFIEKNGMVKISFRSKGDVPVNMIAREHFNGGGHINAAGGRTDLSMQKAVALFKEVLPEYKNIIVE